MKGRSKDREKEREVCMGMCVCLRGFEKQKVCAYECVCSTWYEIKGHQKRQKEEKKKT
jgi:hypothetical protein